jgi:hypothetical protein
MPRYSLSQLVDRANSGEIGFRGLRRLQQAGLNPNELAASGVQSPLQRDPAQDLEARRAVLYGRALQAASAAPPGGQLSAGVAHRLELGPGGEHSRDTFAPHSAQEVQALGANGLQSAIEAFRRRKAAIGSAGAVYQGF